MGYLLNYKKSLSGLTRQAFDVIQNYIYGRLSGKFRVLMLSFGMV